MEYSKIKKIKLKDYCGYDNVEIDFSDSNIIALKGENGVGKTMLIDAFSVIGRDKPVKGKLNDLIQDGKSEFRIECELEDGTKIIREKGKKNKCKVIDKSGEVVLDIQKIDKGYDIKEVVDRIGFWEESETKQCLQVRSYHEPLLFTETKSSENYKIMYNALKVDEVLKAVKYGNEDCNSIKGEIREELAKKKGLLELKENTKVVDTTELEKIYEKLEREKAIKEKIDNLRVLVAKSKEIQDIKIPKKIPKTLIFMNRIRILQEINKVLKCKRLFVEEMNNIKELIDKEKKLKEQKEKCEKELKALKILCPHCGKEICEC